MPAPGYQLLYCTTVVFKILYHKIKNGYSFCFSFIYHLCEKCYKPITVEYNIADYVSYIPRLTFLDIRNKLDLGIHSQNRTPLYVGNLLYLCTQLSTVIQSVRVFKSLMCARHCGGCWRRAKRISCLCSVQTHSQKGHCPAQRRHPSGSF